MSGAARPAAVKASVESSRPAMASISSEIVSSPTTRPRAKPTKARPASWTAAARRTSLGRRVRARIARRITSIATGMRAARVPRRASIANCSSLSPSQPSVLALPRRTRKYVDLVVPRQHGRKAGPCGDVVIDVQQAGKVTRQLSPERGRALAPHGAERPEEVRRNSRFVRDGTLKRIRLLQSGHCLLPFARSTCQRSRGRRNDQRMSKVRIMAAERIKNTARIVKHYRRLTSWP